MEFKRECYTNNLKLDGGQLHSAKRDTENKTDISFPDIRHIEEYRFDILSFFFRKRPVTMLKYSMHLENFRQDFTHPLNIAYSRCCFIFIQQILSTHMNIFLALAWILAMPWQKKEKGPTLIFEIYSIHTSCFWALYISNSSGVCMVITGHYISIPFHGLSSTPSVGVEKCSNLPTLWWGNCRTLSFGSWLVHLTRNAIMLYPSSESKPEYFNISL